MSAQSGNYADNLVICSTGQEFTLIKITRFVIQGKHAQFSVLLAMCFRFLDWLHFHSTRLVVKFTALASFLSNSQGMCI